MDAIVKVEDGHRRRGIIGGRSLLALGYEEGPWGTSSFVVGVDEPIGESVENIGGHFVEDRGKNGLGYGGRNVQ